MQLLNIDKDLEHKVNQFPSDEELAHKIKNNSFEMHLTESHSF